MLRGFVCLLALAALTGVASAQQAGVWRNDVFQVDYGAAGWHALGDPGENAAFTVSPANASDVRCALFAHREIALPGGPFTSQADVNHAVANIVAGRDGYSAIETAAGFTYAENLIREPQATFRSYKFAVYETGGRATIYDLQCGARNEGSLGLTRLRPLLDAIRLN